MNLSPRMKLLALVAALVVAFIALFVVLVLPQFGRYASLESDINEADNRVEEATTLLERRREAKENAASTDAGLIQLAAAVPETPDLPSLIIEMQDLAYENNVVIRQIQPDEITRGEGFVTIPVRVLVWGDWADCVSFVQQSQKLTRQVRVFEVTADALDESDLTESIQELDLYSIEVAVLYHTYVIPETSEQTATAPAGAAPAQ